MNRSDIKEKLRAFPYDPAEYWVVAGGAMVLYGLRAETADLDLGCSSALADRLEAEGVSCRLTADGMRHIRLGGEIELFENWLYDRVVRVEGVPVISLEGLLEMKRRLGREKDKDDIRRITERMDLEKR